MIGLCGLALGNAPLPRFVILNGAKRSEESILKKGMKMDASLRSA
jgi:hypothetical protein